MKIRFSIVTVTYHAAQVLQRTLDSVLVQSYSGIEHLIIDGASTDATLSMVMAYKQQSDSGEGGHEVRILSEPDHGLYDAMNKALRLATGDYIVFLNAGDVLPSEHTLQSVSDTYAKAVEQDGVEPGVMYGDTDVVDNEGNFLYHRKLQPPRKLSWRSFKWGMLVCHQAFYARTEIAKEIPYNLQYRYSADVDWCIRVMYQTEQRHMSLRRVPTVLVNYLEGGMSIKNHRASLRERFAVMRSHYGLFTTLTMHVWFVLRNLKSI